MGEGQNVGRRLVSWFLGGGKGGRFNWENGHMALR